MNKLYETLLRQFEEGGHQGLYRAIQRVDPSSKSTRVKFSGEVNVDYFRGRNDAVVEGFAALSVDGLKFLLGKLKEGSLCEREAATHILGGVARLRDNDRVTSLVITALDNRLRKESEGCVVRRLYSELSDLFRSL